MDHVEVIAQGDNDQNRNDDPAIVQAQLHPEYPRQLDL
jgi:hypothetical protein